MLAACVAAICTSGGCYRDKASALLPCPSGGIELLIVDAGPPPSPKVDSRPPSSGECSGGVCPATTWSCPGTVCKRNSYNEQVADYKRYACARPQVCPDTDIQAIRHDITTGAIDLMFLITNCSTGNQSLEIDKVVVYGDNRCSFSNVADADISPKIVPPGETAAIRITYNPTATGEDHAQLAVMSNAQNSSELRLRLCGLAINASSPPPGGWPTLYDVKCQYTTSLSVCHK